MSRFKITVLVDGDHVDDAETATSFAETIGASPGTQWDTDFRPEVTILEVVEVEEYGE